MRRFILLIFALVVALLALTTPVATAPPELPIYDQPPCPDAGYMWVPGHWLGMIPTMIITGFRGLPLQSQNAGWTAQLAA